MLRVFRNAAAGSVLMALVACQSGGNPLDALDPGNITDGGAASAPGAAAPSTIGNGPVRIAVLLPLSAAGQDGARAKSALDAVALAASDLGADAVTVSIRDTAGAEGQTRALATDEFGKRAVVVIGPSDPAGAAELGSIKGGKRPPFLVLAALGARAPGTYSLPLSEVDSAIGGIVAAIGQGRRNFALLIGDGPSAPAMEARLSEAILNNGGLVEARARYRNSESAIAAALAAVGDAETRPDVIVIATGGQPAGALISALAGSKVRGARLVGTSAWATEEFTAKGAEGAIIASVDSSEMKPMLDRFRKTYGRDPQLHEAYAYDAMALSAGLARVLGETGFAAKNLTVPTGFRSTTGVFRLMPDGSVQRLLALYQVKQGRLQRVGAAPSSF